MAESFRQLVAEVVGKYPQYQQILVDIRSEHSSVKTTLNTARGEINRLDSLSKEYVKTLTGIRTTTEQARDSALRYAKEANEYSDSAKAYRDGAKGHKDDTYKLFLQVESAIGQINAIAKEYEKIDISALITQILNTDANFELAFNRIVSLLILEPQYVGLRDEILENQRIILQDIKLQGNLATNLYTDTREMLASEKIEAYVFLKEVEKRLESCNQQLLSANKMIDSNKEILLDALTNEWLNGVRKIQIERDDALFKIDALKTKATSEIVARESNIDALFVKTQSIISDSKELAELCKNYAFVHRVREFTAVKRLVDAASYANYIQSQSQKALLTYTQWEARVSRDEAQKLRDETQRLKDEAEANLAAQTKKSAELLEEIKTNAVAAMTEIAEENIDETTKIKNEAIAETQKIAAENIEEVTQIKDEAIEETTALKDQTQELLEGAQEQIEKNLESVEAAKDWVEQKTTMLFFISHLKGVRND